MTKFRKKYTRFVPMIRSRHPSHSVLRRSLPLFPFRSVIRFGSQTEIKDTRQKGGSRVEINTIEAINNSSNKKTMKDCFKKSNIRTAVWYTFRNGKFYDEINEITVIMKELVFPIIAKRLYGSRGKGNTKIDSLQNFNKFISENMGLNNYIFEKYYNYAREYRLHVTEDGCFYACRKMMRFNTPDKNKWFKNNNNCVWIIEKNNDFQRPSNWKEVVKESIKALKSTGLDFGAIDLRIQSASNPTPAFIIVEINSAPSFGILTEEKYREMLPKLLIKKSKST